MSRLRKDGVTPNSHPGSSMKKMYVIFSVLGYFDNNAISHINVIHVFKLQCTFFVFTETDIADICTASRTDPIQTEGYIATPFLSSGNYFGSLDCRFEIVGTNIRLHLITVNLTDHRDCLEIHNTLRLELSPLQASYSKRVKLVIGQNIVSPL